MTEFALKNPLYVWLLALLCIVGGWFGLENIGRLEDPPYPLKQAFVFTEYPGASAEEVEEEITEQIEKSVREMPWIHRLESRSVAGRSEVEIELHRWVTVNQAPQIWDEMRRRISEAEMRLPPRASTPLIEDDFSDVYGIIYAVTMPEGYSISEYRDAANLLQKRLQNIRHVGKVQIDGLPEEQIFLDFDITQLLRLGISYETVLNKIRAQTDLYSSTSLRVGEYRLRLDVQDYKRTLDDLRSILIGEGGSSEMIRLDTIASVSRSEKLQPQLIIRHDQERVFTIGVSVVTTQNVVEVGKQVERKIDSLRKMLPAGMSINPIYEQHRVVDRSISDFLGNLSLSILTVILVLCIFTGWRAGAMVGATLLVTIMGTLAFMTVAGIQLHRISLGAIMISMGMLVDNAIVIAEGMVTGMQRGESPQDAATKTVAHTRMPLLGATIVGMAAFSPIGLSTDSTGQYLNSLFFVAGGSLLLSWILSITLIPSLGAILLRPETSAKSESNIYSGRLYNIYRTYLKTSLKNARITCLTFLIIVGASFAGFGALKQGFFPNMPTPIFYVDLYFPEGTDILQTSDRVSKIESVLSLDRSISGISTWVGRGPSRFTLITIPERPNSAYSQMAIRTSSLEEVERLVSFTRDHLEKETDLEFIVRRAEMTPGGSWKIEARFLGEDASTLRFLANQSLDIFREHGLIDTRTNWRQRSLALVPKIDNQRAQATGIDRTDISNSLAFLTNGIQVAMFRDKDKQVPIIARSSSHDAAGNFLDGHVWSRIQQKYIPLRNVISASALIPEESMIMRRDRIRSIVAQANPPEGTTAAESFSKIRESVEQIKLPTGYNLVWGGEYESNNFANESLGRKFPAAVLVMVLTTLIIFGRIRQTIVAWTCLPLIPVGVLSALLVTNLPFNFPSVLGLIGLIGMLLKNAIVLIGEIDRRVAMQGLNESIIIASCVSRLRPISLAAITTVAGMAPLLSDVFFQSMAVTIMGGLALSSLLSLLSIPVFYAIAHGKKYKSN